jgi:hypothetical protein
MKGVGKPYHKYLDLGEPCPHPSQNLSTTTIESLLHRINPSAKKNICQTPQGMTVNYHENIALIHSRVFGIYM